MKRVTVGATVTLQATQTGKRRQYTLVPADEADVKHGRISVASPIGKAVLEHEVGDEITVVLPQGPRRYEIVDVTPDTSG